jgi:hypothetical protein
MELKSFLKFQTRTGTAGCQPITGEEEVKPWRI